MLHGQDRRIEAAQVAHDVVSFRHSLAAGGTADDGIALAASLDTLASALADLGRTAQAADVAR